MGDDPDVDRLVLQDRALLDVQLEEGMHGMGADGLLALKADPLEFVPQRLAFAVLARISQFLGVNAGEHARGNHRRGVARAFFVGPVGDFDRPPRPDVEVVERTHDLERAEHSERAVELAAGRLGVEMAAHHHGGERIVRAGAAREHVAHLVDRDRAAGGLAPFPEQLARLTVEIGQRQALNAALRRGADFRHFHERIPEPSPVDAHIRQVSHQQLQETSANASIALTKWSNDVTLSLALINSALPPKARAGHAAFQDRATPG